jgi:GNAT superfamily N-acetyltransferase
MDKAELLEIFTRQQRIEVDYPDIRREEDGSVIRYIDLAGGRGFVIYSRLDEGNVEAAITAQIARFQAIPQDFEWKAYDYDTPPDLIERLRRRGFEIEEPEALLVLDLTARPAALERPAPPSVVRITDPEDIDQVVALENTVWGTDHHDLGEQLKRDLREHPEMLSVFLAYEGREPVSAAWIYFHAGSSFASLWGGSTLAQFRSRGHYSRLLAARAQEAAARGFTLLTVDASPMSRPILEKHGFQNLATSTPCKWMFPV